VTEVLRLDDVWTGFDRGRDRVSVLEGASLSVGSGRIAGRTTAGYSRCCWGRDRWRMAPVPLAVCATRSCRSSSRATRRPVQSWPGPCNYSHTTAPRDSAWCASSTATLTSTSTPSSTRRCVIVRCSCSRSRARSQRHRGRRAHVSPACPPRRLRPFDAARSRARTPSLRPSGRSDFWMLRRRPRRGCPGAAGASDALVGTSRCSRCEPSCAGCSSGSRSSLRALEWRQRAGAPSSSPPVQAVASCYGRGVQTPLAGPSPPILHKRMFIFF
jgi:hypothetical protein